MLYIIHDIIHDMAKVLDCSKWPDNIKLRPFRAGKPGSRNSNRPGPSDNSNFQPRQPQQPRRYQNRSRDYHSQGEQSEYPTYSRAGNYGDRNGSSYENYGSYQQQSMIQSTKIIQECSDNVSDHLPVTPSHPG